MAVPNRVLANIARLKKELAAARQQLPPGVVEEIGSDEGSELVSETASTNLDDRLGLNNQKIRKSQIMHLKLEGRGMNEARVKIHGMATKLMQETKSATLLCKIESEILSRQLQKFSAKQDPDGFGVCICNKLTSQPWISDEAPETKNDDRPKPDHVLCCIRQDFAYVKPGEVVCEMTFVNKGKLMYVGDVAALGPSVVNQDGEDSSYLGIFKTIYDTARDFYINIETKRPMRVIACTEFETAEDLHTEIKRRADYFFKEGMFSDAEEEGESGDEGEEDESACE